jgi:hypothetical protein
MGEKFCDLHTDVLLNLDLLGQNLYYLYILGILVYNSRRANILAKKRFQCEEERLNSENANWRCSKTLCDKEFVPGASDLRGQDLKEENGNGR